jgi:hypothetical protein
LDFDGNDHNDYWKYAPYRGPGDIVPGASGWWGLRAYASANASAGSKAINIRRASDNSTKDITVLANGGLDVVTASSFCSSTTCYVTTFYDQSGNGLNVTQSTTTLQPQLVFNCSGTHPCVQAGASEQYLNFANTYTLPFTISTVAMRNTNGSVNSADIISNSSGTVPLAFSATANTVYINDGNATVAVTATDSAWQAIQAIHNGTTSMLYANGTTSSGNSGSTATVGTSLFDNGPNSQTVSFEEIGWWPSAFSSAIVQGRITTNQRAYWGF